MLLFEQGLDLGVPDLLRKLFQGDGFPGSLSIG
jgi:hypothetical protein